MEPEKIRSFAAELNNEFETEHHRVLGDQKEITDDGDLWEVVLGCDVYDAERTRYGKIVGLERDRAGSPMNAIVALNRDHHSQVSMPLSWIGIVGPSWVILDRTSDTLQPGMPRF